MNAQLLQCLHHSKVLLLHAEAQEWDQFIGLHPTWENEVDECLIENSPQLTDLEKKEILSELISDIDRIQTIVKSRMEKIESEFSQVIQHKKAMNSYLK